MEQLLSILPSLSSMLIILFVLQLVDVWTTFTILTNGGRELNPVMDKLIDAVGLIPALLIKVVAVMAVLYYVVHYAPLSISVKYLVMGLAFLLYTWVAIHNIRELE